MTIKKQLKQLCKHRVRILYYEAKNDEKGAALYRDFLELGKLLVGYDNYLNEQFLALPNPNKNF